MRELHAAFLHTSHQIGAYPFEYFCSRTSLRWEIEILTVAGPAIFHESIRMQNSYYGHEIILLIIFKLC